MKHSALITALVLSFAAPSMALADCYAVYKAKRDAPLRLHVGVIALPGSCPSSDEAQSTVAARLANGGWTLLNILSLSSTAPSAQTKANAGDFYLRY